MRKLIVATLGVMLLLSLCALAAKDPENFSDLSFTVLKDDNSKPIRNAAVVLHQINKEGRQERGGFELKTDSDGKTAFNGVPYGKLRVQVIAPGFQTFGEDYDIKQPKHDIVIKLKRPQKQYSIYDK